jgi:hypothetical protein
MTLKKNIGVNRESEAFHYGHFRLTGFSAPFPNSFGVLSRATLHRWSE